MPDGSTAVSATAAYARVYEEQQPRLVAFARSLTRNAHAAEDLVAEAHFRVWRRLAAGHEIENVPAYLMTTVRHLATAAGTAVRETPRDPHADEQVQVPAQGGDPAEQVSSVDLVVRVLGQLPERWVKALWLAEAEGQPLAAIGPHLGTKEGATAVLLHRAREGMRQAFLRAQTGAPDDPACQVHWARMPAYVRGAASAKQSERLLGHVDTCDDCRARLAALMSANDRLPALVGPALLVLAVGGTGKFLLAFATAGSAGAAGVHGGGVLHGVRHVMGGGSKPVAVAAGAVVAGAAALVLVIGAGGTPTVPSGRVPVADRPVAQVPVAEAPVGPPPTRESSKSAKSAKSTEGKGTSARVGTVGAVPSPTVGSGTAVPEPRVVGRHAGDGVPAAGDEPPDSAPTPTAPTAPKETDPTPPATGGTGDEPTAPEPPAGDTPEPTAPEPPAGDSPETPQPPTEGYPQAPEPPPAQEGTDPTPPVTDPGPPNSDPAPPSTGGSEDEPKTPTAPESPSAPGGDTTTPETPAPSAPSAPSTPPTDTTPEPETPSTPSPTPAPASDAPTPVDPEPVDETSPAPPSGDGTQPPVTPPAQNPSPAPGHDDDCPHPGHG